MPNAKLTTTEAETLAVMMGSALKHIARAHDDHGKYVWPITPGDISEDIVYGFYEIAPIADTGVTL